MFNKFKTEKKQKNLLIVLMLFLFGLTTVFAVGFQNNNSVRAFTNTDTTSYVTVGELWNGSSFSSTNLNILYKYLTGNASATISNVDTLANNKTTANTIRSKTLSAGTQSGTSYSAKSSSQSVVVTLGGMEWIVTYLSKDKSGNTIATLWLSNNEQDIFEGRSQTEGAYYGYYNGGLYSDWSANWGSNSPEYSYPSNMYGTSYISVVTLNNGGSYSSKSGGATLASFTPTSSSVFAKFTMESVAGSLTDYIVTPSQVSWQENGQHTASNQTGGWSDWTYDAPNQNWSDSHTGNYNSSYNGTLYNYAGKTGNSNWKNHYLWLPSITETGIDDSHIGIWDLNTNERANYTGSSPSSIGLVGSSSGMAFPRAWLRSGDAKEAGRACDIFPSGSTPTNSYGYLNNSLAVRPALHLNLTAIALSIVSSLDDGKGSITATNLEFTGSNLTPSVTVKYNGTTLNSGTDYTLSYSPSIIKNAGAYTVTATGKGSYEGSISTTFQVTQKAITSLSLSPSSTTYNGQAQPPTITVTAGTYTLTSSEYTVSYQRSGTTTTDFTSAGTIVVSVTASGNCKGTLTQNYVINPKNFSSGVTVDAIANETYTGSAITPTIIVKDGNTVLQQGKDYSVNIPTATNVGTHNVTITGTGNYTGTLSTSFNIVAKSIANAVVSDIPSQTYTGSALTPSITVQDGTVTLNKGTDYTVTYRKGSESGEVVSSIIDAGTYYVSITGTGNYTGTASTVKTFVVNQKSISGNVSFSSIANQTYSNSTINPSFTVTDSALSKTLTKNTDYSVSYPADCVNVGTKTITITGKGNYTGSTTTSFEIVARNISNATIKNAITGGDTLEYVYSRYHIVLISVYDYQITENYLSPSSDYDISFPSDYNVGTHTLTITSKGN